MGMRRCVNKRRVHFMTKYTRVGASSRYRTFQYLSALQAAGFECVVSPLFDDAYLAYKYSKGSASALHVLVALSRRLLAVSRVPRGAVVVIEYELLPYFPALLERWLAWRGCRLVMDYDDAMFHQYDQNASPVVRLLLGSKIATVMRLADTVVVGNAYLADYALRAKARRVKLIPTVIDLVHYPAKPPEPFTSVFTIGWIGSPSTSKYLNEIAPALAEVCEGGQACLRLIGAGLIDLPGVTVEVLPWSEETEVEELLRVDVGIMPLPDEAWARGKCGFKLIQYMACGLPVVASPVGINEEIVEHGVNGFLAKDHDQWVQALRTLLDDKKLRLSMGAIGRQRVESRYCLQVTTQKLMDLVEEVVAGEGGN